MSFSTTFFRLFISRRNCKNSHSPTWVGEKPLREVRARREFCLTTVSCVLIQVLAHFFFIFRIPQDEQHQGIKKVYCIESDDKSIDKVLLVERAQATLESLKVVPRERCHAGKNSNFTCSNCHYKGHRVNNCRQPLCRGYFECGQLSLH